MPTVTTFSPTDSLYAFLVDLSALEDATIAFSSGTGVTFDYGDTRIVLGGSGFTTSGTGAARTLTGGTITEIQIYSRDGTQLTLTTDIQELSLSAAALQSAINTDGAGTQEAAIENLFLALGWTHEGAPGATVISQPGNSIDGTLLQLTGTNTWNLSSAANLVTGGSGVDAMFGMGGKDVLEGGDGEDALFGGDGFDELYGGDDSDALFADLNGALMYGGDGSDSLNGGLDSAAHTAFGGAGDDHIVGGAGVSDLDGGSGSDSIQGMGGADEIDGADDNDSIDAGEGNDEAYGGAGNDIIIGGAGKDSIWGDAGQDTVSGQDGSDVIQGGDARDILDGGAGLDTIYGDAGSDVVKGGAGNDTLYGGNDNDRIIGGAGADRMTGNSGADDFVFLTTGDMGKDAARDVVTDFVSGSDDIDLSALDLTFVGTGKFTDDHQVRWNAASSLLMIDMDGDGVADFQIELSGVSDFKAGDLIL